MLVDGIVPSEVLLSQFSVFTFINFFFNLRSLFLEQNVSKLNNAISRIYEADILSVHT